jgi:hypothetical protein
MRAMMVDADHPVSPAVPQPEYLPPEPPSRTAKGEI